MITFGHAVGFARKEEKFYFFSRNFDGTFCTVRDFLEKKKKKGKFIFGTLCQKQEAADKYERM